MAGAAGVIFLAEDGCEVAISGSGDSARIQMVVEGSSVK
jgi:hypothetical protein